jgi:NADPH2:quinone reductase
MKAAVLQQHGATPVHDDFEEPSPGPGQAVVDVAGAGVHHLALAKASGDFYTGPPPVPSVVGTDGVGRLADGRRVFFDQTVEPHGPMAERTLVPEDAMWDVPEGVDDAVAAALGNTGLAAWLALEYRAALREGETVLVLGATGALGSVAVQVARVLGAGRVVAAARGGERLEHLRGRGADAVVALDAGGDLPATLREATGGGADVTIDALWGEPALAAMRATARGARHVQLGQSAAATLEIPAPVLRAPGLSLLGFAYFQAPPDVQRDAYRRLAQAAADGAIELEVERVPLAEVGSAWERQRRGAGRKLVVVP